MRNAAEASAREALRRELEREVATGGAAAVGEASRVAELLPRLGNAFKCNLQVYRGMHMCVGTCV